MKRHHNCLPDNAMSASQSRDFCYIDEILPISFHDLLAHYLPIKTVALILSCYQGYQTIINEVITCVHKLTYIKCDYWQELVFIWDDFMALQRNQKLLKHHKQQTAHHAYRDVVQQFYLCHIRFFQKLLDSSWAINELHRHKIVLYLNKLQSAAYCHI